MPILGIVASSNYPRVTDTGVMFPISTITVGSAGAASVTFSSIPQTYTHLQVRAFSKSNYSAGTDLDGCSLRFNSDSGSNYADHWIIANGSAVNAGGDINRSYMALYQQNNNTYSVSSFAVGIIDILDYTNTNKFKTTRTLGGSDTNGTGNEKGSLSLWSGLWRSTSAITSITLQSGAMNRGFPQYSQFALYGIKGA